MNERIAHPRSVFLCCLAVIVLGLVALAACVAPATPGPTATPTQTPQPAVSEDDWTRINDAGVLQVASSLDNPPFDTYSVRLDPDGFDIALITDLAHRLGLKVEFSDFAFEGLLDGLDLKQADAAIAAMAVTDDRRAQADFTTAYYLGEDGILAAPDSSIAAVTSADDLASRRVGVVRGTVYESWLQKNLIETGKMPAGNLQTYTKASDAVRSLTPGHVDLVILDREVAQTYADEGLAKVVGKSNYQQNYGIAVRRGSSLLPQLNRALAEAQADGTVARLAERYLNIPPDKLLPTPTPAPQPTAAPTPAGSPTPAPCKSGSDYGTPLDLTIPDGTVMQPGQTFTKSWRIVNSGTCDWTANYSFVYAYGDSRMGGKDAPIGAPVPVDSSYDASVAMVAPSAPGSYTGYWQMQDATGVPFGKRVSVKIQVQGQPTAVPPTPTAVPGISFWADSYQIKAGQSTTIHWRTQSVQAVYFYQEGQSWQNYPVTGNEDRSVRPDRSTTYYLRVVFPNGTTQTPSLRITVEGSPALPVITQFYSNPQGQVNQGQCLDLYWEVQGDVSRVALVRNGYPLQDYGPVSGSYDCDKPDAGDYTYELQAWGAGGSGPTKRQLSIKVKGEAPPPPPQITRFDTNPQGSVLQGQCVDLSWDVTGNWDTLWLAVNGNQVTGGTGTYSYRDCDCPQTTDTCNYHLHVSGPGGEDNDDRSVAVIMQTLPGNPAATFCEDNGGQYNSEQGTCTLSDGTVCDAWAYVNTGECPAPE
jgi:polar amino acid transport system substrate-binding protein